MMKRNMIGSITRKALCCLLIAGMSASIIGCGAEVQAPAEENIELLNPVGVALNHEKAAYRNLYDYKVFAALTVPYTEEYELVQSQTFENFSAYPGEEVKRGDVILHSNTQNIDKQIEDLSKYIKEMENDYAEYIKETTESLIDPIQERDFYKAALDKHIPQKPDETIVEIDPETGEEVIVPNPEYEGWAASLDYTDGRYRSLYISIEKTEEAMRQRTAMYELDHKYQVAKLNRLREDRRNYTLSSKMDGVVTSVKLMATGDWMRSETPLVAVADPTRKLLKSDYINKALIVKAEDVYAIINGKRYEVDYQTMDNDEYNRLQERNDKVYSTFRFSGDVEDVEFGSFATIVILNKKLEQVLAVPKDAVRRDENGQYVYVVNGSESIYTPVKTGFSDGVYTEIVSGLEAGVDVLTEKATYMTGKTTVQVKKGSISNEFSSTGYMYYPSAEWVTNKVKYGTAYFVESHVSMYQEVKKGDVVATIKVVADNISLEKYKKQLSREQERLAELEAQKVDENSKKSHDQAVEAKQEVIKDLQKTINDMSADFRTTEIKATVDGIVTDIRQHEEQSLIYENDTICQISEETRSYIFVVDDKSQLTYGNKATISYKSNGQDGKAIGEVVTMNSMAISKALTTDNKTTTGWRQENAGALVALSPEDAGKMAGSNQTDNWWSRASYNVTVTTRSMDNVLVVPKKAVKENNGATYVNVKLADGTVETRSFIAGGSNNSYYWIVEGLTEGMEICLE